MAERQAIISVNKTRDYNCIIGHLQIIYSFNHHLTRLTKQTHTHISASNDVVPTLWRAPKRCAPHDSAESTNCYCRTSYRKSCSHTGAATSALCRDAARVDASTSPHCSATPACNVHTGIDDAPSRPARRSLRSSAGDRAHAADDAVCAARWPPHCGRSTSSCPAGCGHDGPMCRHRPAGRSECW